LQVLILTSKDEFYFNREYKLVVKQVYWSWTNQGPFES